MDARLNTYDNAIAMKFDKHLDSSGAVVTDSRLPAATQELVKIRGQPDQRVFRLPRLAHQGRRASRGSPVRLHLAAAWREATVFTEAEKPPWS